MKYLKVVAESGEQRSSLRKEGGSLEPREYELIEFSYMYFFNLDKNSKRKRRRGL